MYCNKIYVVSLPLIISYCAVLPFSLNGNTL